MKIKITKTGLILAVTLVLIGIVAAPAAAYYSQTGFPTVTRTSGTFNGSVYTGTTSPPGGSFDVPNGTVLWARLYTGVWGGTSGGHGWYNVTFNEVYTKEFTTSPKPARYTVGVAQLPKGALIEMSCVACLAR